MTMHPTLNAALTALHGAANMCERHGNGPLAALLTLTAAQLANDTSSRRVKRALHACRERPGCPAECRAALEHAVGCLNALARVI